LDREKRRESRSNLTCFSDCIKDTWLSSPKTEMASGIFVNEFGKILISLFFSIGKRVTILLRIFFDHKLAQSLLIMGLGRVVTPPA
jgi:hypothetical protein